MTDSQVLNLDFTGCPLPESYLAELGRLSALWCILEAQLDLCLGQVAGFNDLSDPRPFILLKHSSSRRSSTRSRHCASNSLLSLQTLVRTRQRSADFDQPRRFAIASHTTE